MLPLMSARGSSSSGSNAAAAAGAFSDEGAAAPRLPVPVLLLAAGAPLTCLVGTTCTRDDGGNVSLDLDRASLAGSLAAADCFYRGPA